jgi:hypothetical protein
MEYSDLPVLLSRGGELEDEHTSLYRSPSARVPRSRRETEDRCQWKKPAVEIGWVPEKCVYPHRVVAEANGSRRKEARKLQGTKSRAIAKWM